MKNLYQIFREVEQPYNTFCFRLSTRYLLEYISKIECLVCSCCAGLLVSPYSILYIMFNFLELRKKEKRKEKKERH